MAVDIAPELYEQIQRRFQEKYDKAQLFGNPIRYMRKKLDAGTATFQDADLFAVEIGSMLSESMIEVLQLDQLPNKQLYYNIAQRTIGPSLQETYGLVSSVAAEVQEELNAAAGIGIRAMTPKVNEDRIHGLVDKAVEAPDQVALNKILQSPVENLMMSAVDDTVKANAELQSKAGLQPIIRRTTVGKCCDWCSALAGTYKYPDDVPKDVYRRHQNCRCTVEYIGAGKRQDVWSKREDVLNRKEAQELESELSNANYIPKIDRIEYAADAGTLPSKMKSYIPPIEERKKIIEKGIQAVKPIYCDEDELLYKLAYELPEKDGFYTVVLHGEPYNVIFSGKRIDADTLCAIIAQREDYIKGTPIRLISCFAGQEEDGVARYVSDKLKVDVMAPDKLGLISKDILTGKYTVYSGSEPGIHDGEMKMFIYQRKDK